MSKAKKIPDFKNEDEARKFWSKHDMVDYFDLDEAIVNPDMPELKPSTKTITIRVSESLLNALKAIANKKDVPYQSLVKMMLDDKVREEIKLR